MQPRKECFSCPCPCHYWQSLLDLTNTEKRVKSSTSTCGTDNQSKTGEDFIIKPENDSKDYRVVTLPNKLKAIVISDPEADKAAAALSILAGSMHDPETIPGIAHFCEHMVFLGTKKYPQENFLGDYLASNAGDYNAFTQRDMTNYYFDVAPSSLEQALDRFAQLFIAPLFLEQSAEREVFAINSEHEKNIPNDGERRTLVDSTLSRKGHPYSKFDCGNVLTLWTRPKEESLDVMGELRKYFNTRYSANLMNLVVYGKENCGELQKMVERSFSPINNLNLEMPSWPESPYGPDELATRIDLVPNMTIASVLLIFPIPDQTEHYKTGAVNYIGTLLSHGGPHSLASLLKRKRWSTSGVYVSYERPGKGFAFLAAEVELTSRGLDMVEEVVKCIFQYIEMARSKGPQKWIWDEIKLINDIGFRFAEKEEPIAVVEEMASGMPNFPARDIIISKFGVIDDYQPELISKLFTMIHPTNMRMIISTKENEVIANKVEEWYGAKYRYSKIDHALVQKWIMCGLNPELRLPHPNPLLPTSFDIKPRDSKWADAEDKAPRLILENFLSQVWFLQDNLYKLPQANLILVILTGKQMEDVKNYNLSELLVRSVMDSISEYCSDVDRAGMNFDLDVALAGFSLVVNGYDCKCGELFEHILKNLIFFRHHGDRFDDIRDDYLRDLENFSEEEPYVHALSYVYDLLRKDNWSNDNLLQDMKRSRHTANDLISFSKEAFAKVKLKWFFHGNLTEQEALNIFKKCSCYFTEVNTKPLNSTEWYRIQQGSREGIIPAGTVNIYPNVHATHWNSATLLLLQCGAGGSLELTLLDLIENILCQAAYDVLRTTEQLGYVVLTYTRKSRGVLSLIVIVQGEKDPSYLDERIENFLSQFSKTIDNLDEEQFRESVEALIVKKAEKPKTLEQYGVKLFDEIIRETYLFNRDDLALKELDTITLKDLQDFFYEWISPSAKKRKKISIQIKSEVDDQDKIDQHSRRTPTSPSVTAVQDLRTHPNLKNASSSLGDSSDSKIEVSLGPPSVIVENMLISGRRGSQFSSRRSSGGKFFGSSSSQLIGGNKKKLIPPVINEPLSDPKNLQNQDLEEISNEGVPEINIQTPVTSFATETDDSATIQTRKYMDDFNASINDDDFLNVTLDKEASQSDKKDQESADVATTEEKLLHQTINESQKEISGYFDDTSGNSTNSKSGPPSNKPAENNKSTSTKRRKKRPSKHMHKRKLHKKPSNGSAPIPICHFYPPVALRKRKLFQSSHQLTLLLKKQALKVKLESDPITGRKTSLVHATSKAKETPYLACLNDIPSTSDTLSSNSAEQVLVKDVGQKLVTTAINDQKLVSLVKARGSTESPSTDSVLRSWVESLVGPEIQKSKIENPRLKNADNKKVTEAVLEAVKKSLLQVRETGNSSQRTSRNSNRSTGNNNRWSGHSKNSAPGKPPGNLTDSFYFNYKRKQTPPKHQIQKPLTSTPRASADDNGHENNLNWSVSEVEQEEPKQAFIRVSHEDGTDRPNKGIISQKESPDDSRIRHASRNEPDDDGDENNPVSKVHHIVTKTGVNVDLQPMEKVHNLLTRSSVHPAREENKENDNPKPHLNPATSFLMMFTGGSGRTSSEYPPNNTPNKALQLDQSDSPNTLSDAHKVASLLIKCSKNIPESEDRRSVMKASNSESPAYPASDSKRSSSGNSGLEAVNAPGTAATIPKDKKSENTESKDSSGISSHHSSGGSIMNAVIRVHTNMMKNSKDMNGRKSTDSIATSEPNETPKNQNSTDRNSTDSDSLPEQNPPTAAHADAEPTASEMPENVKRHSSKVVPKLSSRDDHETPVDGTAHNVEDVRKPTELPNITDINLEGSNEPTSAHTSDGDSSIMNPKSRMENVITRSTHRLPTLVDPSASTNATSLPISVLEEGKPADTVPEVRRSPKISFENEFEPPIDKSPEINPLSNSSTGKANSNSKEMSATTDNPRNTAKVSTDSLPSHTPTVSTIIPDSNGRHRPMSKVPVPVNRNSASKKLVANGKAANSVLPLEANSALSQTRKLPNSSDGGSTKANENRKRGSPELTKDFKDPSSESSAVVHTIVSANGGKGMLNVDWSPSSFEEVDSDLGSKNHSSTGAPYLEIPSSAVLSAIQSSHSGISDTDHDSIDVPKSTKPEKSKLTSKSADNENKPPYETRKLIVVAPTNKSEPVRGDANISQMDPDRTRSPSASSRERNVFSSSYEHRRTDTSSSLSSGQQQPPSNPKTNNYSTDSRVKRRVNVIKNIDEWKSSLEYYPLPTPSLPSRSISSSENSGCSNPDLTDCALPDQNLNNNSQQMPCHFHYCPNHGLRQIGSCQSSNGTSWEIHVPQSNNFLCTEQYQHYSYHCHQQPQ